MIESKMDKLKLINAHLEMENRGLYLAYSELYERIKLLEKENKELKQKLNQTEINNNEKPQ